jgi:glycosyltransferase involved in cell wall biosynthesis
MRVVFLTPHTKISGGVKVIFKLAQGLKAKGVQVCVVAKKHNDKTMFWFGDVNFKIVEDRNPTYHSLPECDILVNYGDGDPYLPLAPGTKQVLLLQNFNVHDSPIEKNNMLFPYDGVIAVSNWLAVIAKRSGQKKIYIISPGIDEAFVPIAGAVSKIPVVGTLHHSIVAKNAALFEETIKYLYCERHIPVKPLFLSARPIAGIESLSSENIPYSMAINPPQSMLPFIYSSCAVWVSPAYREGFGLTTLEAMACGTPVVTLKNFGLDDYIKHGENCIIVKNSKKEVAEAIIELINSPEMRKNIIKNGSILAEKFTWEKTINQCYYALQEISKQ